MNNYKRLTKLNGEPKTIFNFSGSVQDFKIYKRLQELEDKIEQGLMVELPKKCYLVFYLFGWEIAEYNVLNIEYDYRARKIVNITCVNEQKTHYTFFTTRDIGETLFLTKAEAEQKLKELLKGDK